MVAPGAAGEDVGPAAAEEAQREVSSVDLEFDRRCARISAPESARCAEAEQLSGLAEHLGNPSAHRARSPVINRVVAELPQRELPLVRRVPARTHVGRHRFSFQCREVARKFNRVRLCEEVPRCSTAFSCRGHAENVSRVPVGNPSCWSGSPPGQGVSPQERGVARPDALPPGQQPAARHCTTERTSSRPNGRCATSSGACRSAACKKASEPA